MADSLPIALKEWAAICRALALGRQSILLRKGGIAEAAGPFQLEATRFLLFPTFVHQQETGVRSEGQEFQDQVNANRPAAGRVRFEAWGEVTGIYQVRDLLLAQLISHLHFLSDDAVEKRFHYRQPGIDVLAVRVFRLPSPVEIDEDASFAGCKSWVPLGNSISVEGSTPALSHREYHDVIAQLDTILRPTAFA